MRKTEKVIFIVGIAIVFVISVLFMLEVIKYNVYIY